LKNRGPGENLGRGTLLKKATTDFERFWEWFGSPYGYDPELKTFLMSLWRTLKTTLPSQPLARRLGQAQDPGDKDREPDHRQPEEGSY
jgi:hypothetical protein